MDIDSTSFHSGLICASNKNLHPNERDIFAFSLKAKTLNALKAKTSNALIWAYVYHLKVLDAFEMVQEGALNLAEAMAFSTAEVMG
jgi:hypothetical protein